MKIDSPLGGRVPVKESFGAARAEAAGWPWGWRGDRDARSVGSRQIDVRPDWSQYLASGMETIEASGPSARVREKSDRFGEGFSVYFPYRRLKWNALCHKPLISLARPRGIEPLFSP
jgi:hypothetical protein